MENVAGDCKKPGCSGGSSTLVNDDSDAPPDNKCKICNSGSLNNRPDGKLDACIVCKNGEEDKVPDNELGSVKVNYAGIGNFISNVNSVLEWLGSDTKIPVVQLEIAKAWKEVCCAAQNGAMTREEEWKGRLSFRYGAQNGCLRFHLGPVPGTITVFEESLASITVSGLLPGSPVMSICPRPSANARTIIAGAEGLVQILDWRRTLW